MAKFSIKQGLPWMTPGKWKDSLGKVLSCFLLCISSKRRDWLKILWYKQSSWQPLWSASLSLLKELLRIALLFFVDFDNKSGVSKTRHFLETSWISELLSKLFSFVFVFASFSSKFVSSVKRGLWSHSSLSTCIADSTPPRDLSSPFTFTPAPLVSKLIEP